MSANRPPRRTYAKTAARRQEILLAAGEVFAAAGYDRGSLREVADRVGISEAGLLHHFPSKERLLEAVLAKRDDDARVWMGSPLPVGVDLLRALVGLIEHDQSAPGPVELHVALTGEAVSLAHPMHAYSVARYASVLANVRAAFDHAGSAGLLRPEVDSAAAARALIALMDGLQVQWLLGRESFDIAADLRRYLDSLLTVRL